MSAQPGADRAGAGAREVALRAGYHSPQVEVEVRLNTNESPEPPPQGFLEALAAEMRTIELNRYPDREATALRAALAGPPRRRTRIRSSAPTARTRPSSACSSPTEAPGVLPWSSSRPTPSIRTSPESRVPRSWRAAGTRTSASIRTRSPAPSPRRLDATASTPRRSPFSARRTTPPAGSRRWRASRPSLSLVPGLVAVDEAYGQFAPRSALELVATVPRLVVLRTFSKTWAMAALRLGYLVAEPAVVACDLERGPPLSPRRPETGWQAVWH